ncbi:lipoprotein [Streptomyces inusitatus]|uniref:Lipoprotein n=1 Tax=Streptomyces inusitatus TaxID=68221 RepID=A0A918PNE5_9ACTN|nr:L,D-transpeptidase family protein [Streptomyces inusitatus]GGZ15682.1 lipoprotein [Streptomyces inusitatus]
MTPRIRRSAVLPAAVLALAALLTGCGAPAATAPPDDAKRPAEPSVSASASVSASVRTQEARREAHREIPGIGPRTLAGIDGRTRQVLVVSGGGADANRSTAALYESGPEAGWRRAAGPWPARNGLKGWTEDHRLGDLRTPIGVYGLTDAGGLLPDPGTELPYDRRPEFTARGTNFDGKSLDGAFDHVVAVNYNRKPGLTPLDWTRPLGEAKGGGIWIHVDHGGATQGCVGLARPRVAELLKLLDPKARPVVVMGPKKSLAR